MSRLKNYARGILSSYAQLGANVVYSLISIPLALAFLPKAEFGLWALMMSLVGYMSLVDLGMTQAVSRLLIDHKDQREEGTYAALVKTAFFVGSAQASIIFGLVALLAPAISALLRVPSQFESNFIALLRVQSAVSAFAFAVRPFSLVLTAHQRMDLCSYGDIFSLLSSLGWLWLFFSRGFGVFSFVFATAISALLVPAFLWLQCRRLGLLPDRSEHGRVTGKLFREVFSYGKDVFLVALGTQMVLASQTLIISRRLGLDAAAVWAIGTKMFTLIGQLISRIIGVSLPALSEMIARGEKDRLRDRFKSLASITSSFSAFLGISFALCNSVFVSVWTGGKVSWSPLSDVLLAVWLCLLSLQAVHNNLVLATKQIGSLRYIFFLEGCTFIAFAVLGSRVGMPGVIAASIICTTAFSLSYGIRRSSYYFECDWITVGIGWIGRGIAVALTFGAVSLLIWRVTFWLPPVQRLVINSLVAIIIGGFILLRFGIPPGMYRELEIRLPQPLSSLLKYIGRSNATTKTS